MTFRALLLPVVASAAALLTALPAAAQNQPAAKGPGPYLAVGGGVSVFQSDYGREHLGGGLVYADVHPTRRYGLEAEARFLRYGNEGMRQSHYLAGPHVNLLRGAFRPYAKFLVGGSHIVLPFGYAEGDFLTYAGGAGIDLQLGRLLLRPLDFEYQAWPDFPYGQLRPYGLSAGVAVRFGGHSRHPWKK